MAREEKRLPFVRIRDDVVRGLVASRVVHAVIQRTVKHVDVRRVLTRNRDTLPGRYARILQVRILLICADEDVGETVAVHVAAELDDAPTELRARLLTRIVHDLEQRAARAAEYVS